MENEFIKLFTTITKVITFLTNTDRSEERRGGVGHKKFHTRVGSRFPPIYRIGIHSLPGPAGIPLSTSCRNWQSC